MDETRTRRLIDRARRLGEDIDRFRSQAPQMQGPQTPTPPFSWEQLERQLADLCGSPARSALATELVSATRKQAWCKPPEMVLREILLLAATLLDDAFPGDCGEEANPTP